MPELLLCAEDENNGMDLYTEIIKDALSRRILILNCEITDDIVENCISHIFRWNIEDNGLPVEKRKKIVLLINSVGGDCFIGNAFCDVIETSTTPVVAIGLGMVASMAYRIFICCHERIAFKNTVLLQHDGSVQIANSTSKARDTMKFFDEEEQRTKEFVLKHTTMTEEFYDKHYEQEFYMHADTLGKEYGCVDKIIGDDITLDEIFE